MTDTCYFIRCFESKLGRTVGMICYEVEGSPYHLLISWKVPPVGRNQFCIHICESSLCGEQKEKEIFYNYIHKKHKHFSDQNIQYHCNAFKIHATMSSR